MGRDFGVSPLNAPDRHDMEAHRERKMSPNMMSRLRTRFRTIAQTQVQDPLDDAIKLGAKLFSYDPIIFLADFHALKSRHMARPDHMFEVVVRAPSKDCVLLSGEDVFPSPEKRSMYDWLDLLRSRLLAVPSDAFAAFCITAEDPKAPLWARSEVLRLLPRLRPRRDRIPREAMIYMASSLPAWKLPTERVKAITNPSRVERYLVHPQLPSTKPNQASNNADLVWRITWPSEITKYKGDIDIYIWRPHSRMPSLAYADLYIPTKSPSQLPSALVLFSSTRVLQTFRQEFTLQLPLFSAMPGPSIALFHLTHAVFRIALNQTRDFMQDVEQQIFDMSLQSRVHPSRERFQYLIYLCACREYAADHMTRNKDLLDEVQRKFKSIMPIHDESQEARLLEELVGKVQIDMEYIEKELAKIESSIEGLRKEIEAQSSLPSRMPTMITILAATYVPLAFVTSFLGMNIRRESVSSWLWSTPYNQSSNNSTSNNSISTNGSNSGAIDDNDPSPQVWDLRWFLILSAPLLFGTIILPLATGPIIRSICHAYVRLGIYWVVVLRILMVLSVFPVYIISPYVLGRLWDIVLVAVASSMIWNARRHSWSRKIRISWGVLLLGLSISDLVLILLVPPLGLVGWALHFAGLAYEHFRRLARKKNREKEAT